MPSNRTTQSSQTKTSVENHNERLSAVEVDVRHLDGRISTLTRNVEEGFGTLRRLMENQRQPITAFAGWAAVILTLVASVLWPQMQVDERHDAALLRLMERELIDAESRGAAQQRFTTLEEQLNSAINNRKDIDAKHTAAQLSLSNRIDEVRHSVDNGLGRRIDEKMLGVEEAIRGLEREVYGEP